MAKEDDKSKVGGVPDAADSNGLDEVMAANPDADDGIIHTEDDAPEQIDGIENRDVESTMENYFIRYSMSVIIDRALPDVRDGLKPVNRRILYAMAKNGWKAPHPTVKSARIVGEVMGKYHPHGDTSIYD